MRIKLDENMPTLFQALLASLGHEPDSVQTEGLSGRDDDTIWRAAQEAGRLLVTQDLDFSDLRKFTLGSHCGIVLFRLSEPGWHAMAARARVVFADERVDEWGGCFVIVTDHKVRVRRPVDIDD